MRDIRFRAWDLNENEYIPWEHLIMIRYNQDFFKDNSKTKKNIVLSALTDPYIILEQFTGLYDSTTWEQLTESEREDWTRSGNMPSKWKGKPIYEGDIINFKSATNEVRYMPEAAAFERFTKNGPAVLNDIIAKKLKIIGNIHENADLLKH